MARKNRDLAGFGDVARVDREPGNVKNEKSQANVPIDVPAEAKGKEPDSIKSNDYLDRILEGKKEKAQDHYILRGFYIEKDLALIIDMLGERGGRGAKSKIVNEALRKIFLEKGLL